MGAAWKAYSNGADLRASQATLELENENYRQATEALASQIGELQLAIADLGDRSDLDPNLARAMDPSADDRENERHGRCGTGNEVSGGRRLTVRPWLRPHAPPHWRPRPTHLACCACCSKA